MLLTHLELVNEVLTKANIDDVKGISTSGTPAVLSGNPSYVTKASRALNMASENLALMREWNFLLRRGDPRLVSVTSKTISGVSIGAACALTVDNTTGITDGDKMLIESITGTVGTSLLNDNYYFVKVDSTTQLSLYSDRNLTTAIASTGYAYTSGGTIKLGTRNVVLADSAIGFHPVRKPKRVYRMAPGYLELFEADEDQWVASVGKTSPNVGYPRMYKQAGIGTLGSYQGQQIQVDPILSSSNYYLYIDHYQLPPKLVEATDTTVWPDYALVLEASIIFFNIRGRQADELRKERDFYLSGLIRADGATPRLALGSRQGRQAITLPQLPADTVWG